VKREKSGGSNFIYKERRKKMDGSGEKEVGLGVV